MLNSAEGGEEEGGGGGKKESDVHVIDNTNCVHIPSHSQLTQETTDCSTSWCIGLLT